MITYKIIRAESKRACEGDLGYRTGRDKKRRFMRLFLCIPMGAEEKETFVESAMRQCLKQLFDKK